MKFTITGKLEKIFPLKSGTSSSSGREWRSQDFLIAYDINEHYQKKMVLQAKGKTIDELNKIPANSNVCCTFEIDSREYIGKWYNSYECWKIEQVLC